MPDHGSDAALKALFADFERSGAQELHLRAGGFELYLSRDAAAPSILHAAPARVAATATAVTPASAIPSTPSRPPANASAQVPPGSVIVAAPNLGTFYRAPKPGAAPYVEIGDEVASGDELCLIEVMKLFTAVPAPADGRIVGVLAEDGAMVEAGAPLFAIEPA